MKVKNTDRYLSITWLENGYGYTTPDYHGQVIDYLKGFAITEGNEYDKKN